MSLSTAKKKLLDDLKIFKIMLISFALGHRVHKHACTKLNNFI